MLVGLRARVDYAGLRRGAQHLAREIADTLTLGRRIARQAASLRLSAEVDVIRRLQGQRGVTPMPSLRGIVQPTDADRALAAQASQSYADALAKHLEDDVPAPTALRKANYLLETIAASQVSEAFNDERSRVENDNRATYAGVLVKLWDAKDDRRTCPVCDKLDGKMRPWGLAFPDGNVPGKVHPKCRCRWNPVPLFLVG